METKLAPIFKLRMLCLQQLKPDFYIAAKEIIEKSSLAAQEYIMSGTYAAEYNIYTTGSAFRNLPGYIAIHKKYGLPYKPTDAQIYNGLNQGLVMDLADSFRKDKTNLIINGQGAIINPSEIHQSETMRVYHNTPMSGVPLNALKIMLPYQREKLLAIAQYMR